MDLIRAQECELSNQSMFASVEDEMAGVQWPCSRGIFGGCDVLQHVFYESLTTDAKGCFQFHGDVLGRG